MIGVRTLRNIFVSTALCFAAGSLVSAAETSSSSAGLRGLWLSQDKDGVFEIASCGDGLCGQLVGLDYEDHVPRDVTGRSECHLMMLTDFSPMDSQRWQGHILDPRTGHTYQARIWNEGTNTLKLRGFVLGVPLLGETQTWTRYKGPALDTECHMAKMSQ